MNYNAKDQYQSMLRAFDALRAIATDIGKTVVIGDHTAGDATKSFFMECYHFKDWLKKDPQIKNPKDVEIFISASCALSLAADLCNSLKHAGLRPNDTPRSGMHLDQISMAYSLDIPATAELGFIKFARNPSDGDTITISRSNRKGSPIATAKIVLTIGGTKYEAPDVATQCIKDWEGFLASQEIQFPKA